MHCNGPRFQTIQLQRAGRVPTACPLSAKERMPLVRRHISTVLDAEASVSQWEARDMEDPILAAMPKPSVPTWADYQRTLPRVPPASGRSPRHVKPGRAF